MTDLHGWITQQVELAEAEGRAMLIDPTPVLRRCEADRRILARHSMWPGSDYCDGCGPDIDTRINECPELLDLAHAHGITDEILASLDRPELPPPPPPHPEGFVGMLRDAFERALGAPITPMTEVPPALRGPNWKADR